MADTKLTVFNADAASAFIDMRSEATNGEGRQVIVLGDPSVNNNVAAVVTQDATGQDQVTPGLLVRHAGSITIGPGSNSIGSVTPGAGTFQVFLPDTGHEIGTIRGNTNTLSIYIPDTGHELGSIRGITNTIAIHHLSTGGTLVIKMAPETGLPAGANSIGSISGITNSINVYLGGTGGTIRVGDIPGSMGVFFSPSNPGVNITSGTITGITNSIAVHHLSTGGTLWIKPDPAGTFFTNGYHTASIFTVSGSTSGVSASGVNLVAPSASYNFKVFAYSIQTTALASVVPRFVNGSGASQTEFWRPLITAATTTSGPVGANLAVTPPGYLFATGTNTSLNLHLDTGVLVHYSVSYIKESA